MLIFLKATVLLLYKCERLFDNPLVLQCQQTLLSKQISMVAWLRTLLLLQPTIRLFATFMLVHVESPKELRKDTHHHKRNSHMLSTAMNGVKAPRETIDFWVPEIQAVQPGTALMLALGCRRYRQFSSLLNRRKGSYSKPPIIIDHNN